MSDTLTVEQEKLLDVYIDKWLKIGMSNDPIDLERGKDIVNNFLVTCCKRDPIEHAFLFDSPKYAWLFVQEIYQHQDKINLDYLNKTRDLTIENKVECALSFIWPYLTGNSNAGYFCYYNFIHDVLGIDLGKEYLAYQATSELNLVYPLRFGVAAFSEKPQTIKMNEKGQLHCDNGPAVVYKDGFSVWILNNIGVDRKIVETPSEKIPASWVIEEKNVQVRAEIIKKIGAEKVCKDFNAKVIDTARDGMYELLELDLSHLPTNTPRRRENMGRHIYLKMRNPSIGIYHIEGVPDQSARTVEAAFHSRKPDAMRRIPVSEQGKDWYLQGDVFSWPENAESLKMWPSKLT